MHANRPLKALALRAGSIALVSTMFMFGKLAAESGIHVLEVVFWRQVAAAPCLLVALGATGRLGVVRTRRFGSHAWRSVLGVAGMLLSFVATILLPLPEATTIGFAAPLFAVVLGVLLFRQEVGPWRALAVLLGFAGVVIIARPGNNALPLLGTAVGLGASFMVALISYQLRDLGRTEAPVAVVFWFSATTAPALALAMPFVMQHHDWFQWALLIGIAVSGVLAQFLMAAALRNGAVSSVIVMDYTALIWSTLYGWFIWGSLPSPTTWIGAPLIIAAGLLIVWREHSLLRAAKPAVAMRGEQVSG